MRSDDAVAYEEAFAAVLPAVNQFSVVLERVRASHVGAPEATCAVALTEALTEEGVKVYPEVVRYAARIMANSRH